VNLEGRRIDFRLVQDSPTRARAGDVGARVDEDGGPATAKRVEAPVGRKAARAKTPGVKEAQAARKNARKGSRGFKKAGGGQPPRPRKKR